MNSAKIIFTPIKIIENEDVVDLIWNYFACLYKNGQVLKNYELIKANDDFIMFVTLPQNDALNEEYHNIYSFEYMVQIKEVFKISMEIIGENLNYGESCTCEKSSWYMLYTDYSEHDSPVVCGDCDKSVPLYLLPHMFKEKGE